jgi:5-methylcytosine-specific restriction endonuclease McrA
MSWHNYGSYWHIDHIIPHSQFNYLSLDDDNFKKCWSLENLRPLSSKQNLINGLELLKRK